MKTPVLSFTLNENKYIWTTRSTDHHTSIHIHILMANITFTYIYPFLISIFFTTCFILIIFHILFMSSFTLLLVLVTIYYHRIAVLCFSYHIIYFIHFLCAYFSFSFMFMPANTLEVDTEEKLYVPEGTITIRDSDLYLYVPEGTITLRDNDLYLYDPNGTIIIIQTGSMSSTQTGPRYL